MNVAGSSQPDDITVGRLVGDYQHDMVANQKE